MCNVGAIQGSPPVLLAGLLVLLGRSMLLCGEPVGLVHMPCSRFSCLIEISGATASWRTVSG